jgi:hypothetical protein
LRTIGSTRRPVPKRPVSRTSPENWPRATDADAAGEDGAAATPTPVAAPAGPGAGPAATSSPLTDSNTNRPLSHSQPWLTGSESMPSSRVTRLVDDCTATRHPRAQVVHVDSTWSRSHGRAVNR